MAITSVRDVITKIEYAEGHIGSMFGIKVFLNPELVNDSYYHRYQLGFAADDVPNNAWPQQIRNLNNNGKLLVRNYAEPVMPESIGEFASRIITEGDIETNSLTFSLPGVMRDYTTITACVFDPDDWELKTGYLTERYAVEAK